MTNQQIDNKLPPETDKFKDEIIEIDLVAIFRKIISFRKTIYKAIGISLVIGIIIAISIPNNIQLELLCLQRWELLKAVVYQAWQLLS